MNDINDRHFRWSTSSFGSAPDTSPMELASLGEHFHRCEAMRGPAFRLSCAREALNKFIMPRLFTSLVLLAVGSALAGTIATVWS